MKKLNSDLAGPKFNLFGIPGVRHKLVISTPGKTINSKGLGAQYPKLFKERMKLDTGIGISS